MSQSPIISNHLRGLVSDSIGIFIPNCYDRLEVLAASSVIARAASVGEPDRHDFISAVSKYLDSLPKDEFEARSVISRDAASVLGVPGLAQDRDEIQTARAAMLAAEANLLEAQSREGRRLGRINTIETQIVSTNAELERWQIDFDGVVKHYENEISERFGDPAYGLRCNSVLDEISRIERLKKLAPAAVAKIKARIGDLEGELQTLRGEPANRKSA